MVDSPRARLRALGLAVGRLPTGPHNAITDVAGLRVGNATVVADAPAVNRTGLTVVQPWPGTRPADHLFAGLFALNGFGEMTGAHWIAESGLLASPVVLTSTYAVGVFRDAMIRWRLTHPEAAAGIQPVVAETNDGWLNDGAHQPLGLGHLEAALAAAAAGPVAEGNVGGGTGMICHEFKGGIGTASREAETPGGRFTVGALVQANYGRRAELTVAGVPVGRALGRKAVPLPREEEGSIIGVVATDAPLLPGQCARLARRAALGLARVGGVAANGSGDLFLAFSTANRLPVAPRGPVSGLVALPQAHLSPLFAAVVEAVEEAILNALCMAETMTGQKGRVVHALPLDRLAGLVRARP